jgi:hypothetical protein
LLFCSIVLHEGSILQNFILVNYNKSYFFPRLMFTNKGGVYLSESPVDDNKLTDTLAYYKNHEL